MPDAQERPCEAENTVGGSRSHFLQLLRAACRFGEQLERVVWLGSKKHAYLSAVESPAPGSIRGKGWKHSRKVVYTEFSFAGHELRSSAVAVCKKTQNS